MSRTNRCEASHSKAPVTTQSIGWMSFANTMIVIATVRMWMSLMSIKKMKKRNAKVLLLSTKNPSKATLIWGPTYHLSTLFESTHLWASTLTTKLWNRHISQAKWFTLSVLKNLILIPWLQLEISTFFATFRLETSKRRVCMILKPTIYLHHRLTICFWINIHQYCQCANTSNTCRTYNTESFSACNGNQQILLSAHHTWLFSYITHEAGTSNWQHITNL